MEQERVLENGVTVYTINGYDADDGERGPCEVVLYSEYVKLQQSMIAERVKSRLMGLDDGLSANCSDDLLAALKAIRDDKGLNDLIAGIGEEPDFWDQMNAAIDKAEGRA